MTITWYYPATAGSPAYSVGPLKPEHETLDWIPIKMTTTIKPVAATIEPRSKAFYSSTGSAIQSGHQIGAEQRPFVGVTVDGKIATQGPREGVYYVFEPADLGIEVHQFAGTIDMTPTWRALLPALIEVAANGTSLKARRDALAELERMADIADAYVAAGKATA